MESRYKIGDNVEINVTPEQLKNCKVSAIKFTEDKVRYDLIIGDTTVNNIDSAFIKEIPVIEEIINPFIPFNEIPENLEESTLNIIKNSRFIIALGEIPFRWTIKARTYSVPLIEPARKVIIEACLWNETIPYSPYGYLTICIAQSINNDWNEALIQLEEILSHPEDSRFVGIINSFQRAFNS